MKHLLETELPVLPLRDVVVFPHIAIPLYVGRSRSVLSIEEALRKAGQILLVTQRDPQVTEIHPQDLHSVGTVGIIKQHARMPDGNLKILIEGVERVRIKNFISEDPFLLAKYEVVRAPQRRGEAVDADITKLMQTLIHHFRTYLKMTGRYSDEAIHALDNMLDADTLVDTIVTQTSIKLSHKQEILELIDAKERLEKLSMLILADIEIIKLDRKIKTKVREQIEKTQRDYFLNEQLSAIQKELGQEGDPKGDLDDLAKRLKEKKMPEGARKLAERELKKLRMSGGHAAEASVIRNYVELMVELPWDEYSTDQLDLSAAENILNEDHHGLKEIKERVLEFLALRARVANPKSPVLCFVGPPGIGKTSLANSIARALGRKFERISLGGLRDEAELRGHRRTYVGALSGKIISAIRRAGVSNPVILLDELDKVGMDWRGDPASTLLEILDPEQNKNFTDHYLDYPYDLSRVLFIATANTLDPLSAPLRDRMEAIALSSYNEKEKIQIALRYLLPKELANHGFAADAVKISEENFSWIIRQYTREAGVRGLQREVAKVCRKLIREGEFEANLSREHIEKLLGTPRFKNSDKDRSDEIGVATGLAWTTVGGETLTIEVNILPGKGKIQITGKLGDVMQESVKAALSYVRSRAEDYAIDPDYFLDKDIHVHIPEGAVPKDGPSAGITLATALLSAVLRVPVRSDLGMTGEITLRGRVLPIGGLREKILAAERSGLKTVLYPFENERDRAEFEREWHSPLELIPVFKMDEVIDKALVWSAAAKSDFQIQKKSKVLPRHLGGSFLTPS